MVYLGSKSKISKDIAGIINAYISQNNIENFYDVFCGGGNLADKIICENVYCNDLSPTLISLHQQAQRDFSILPENCSREDWDAAYKEYKKIISNLDLSYGLEDYQKMVTMPLYQIGAIEWYGSYSTKGFQGGFAKPSERLNRNYFNEHKKNHYKQVHENPNYMKINFSQGDYKKISFKENSVIYCDSPYKSTVGYQINRGSEFNFEEYYNWLREQSKKYPIFISEQYMPDDFKVIWEKEVRRTTSNTNNTKASEKLFFIDNRKIDF